MYVWIINHIFRKKLLIFLFNSKNNTDSSHYIKYILINIAVWTSFFFTSISVQVINIDFIKSFK